MAKELNDKNIGEVKNLSRGSFSFPTKGTAPLKGEKLHKVFDIQLGHGSVTAGQKAVFAKNMSIMLRSGLTVSEALDIVVS